MSYPLADIPTRVLAMIHTPISTEHTGIGTLTLKSLGPEPGKKTGKQQESQPGFLPAHTDSPDGLGRRQAGDRKRGPQQ